MKNKLLILLAFVAMLSSCDSGDENTNLGGNSLTFEGSYSREFDVQGVIQRATYQINQTNINYDLTGGISTNYDTKKEYYSESENKWVGYRESNSTYYVIFFKNVTENQITLYKKEVASLEEGKNEPIPAANDTDNHGWNTYAKNLPISGKIENLYAPQEGGRGEPESGEFVKFDFKTGKVTTDDTNWDIAFRSTTIVVNGGESSGITDEPVRNGDAAAYISVGTMDDITTVDTALLVQDSASGLSIPTGSGNGWYNYTGAPDHLIIPIAGRILVFKTRDGKYGKIEILSYYKDGDSNSDSRYYTFNYVYQPIEGVVTF